MRPGSSGVIVNGLRDLYHLGAITPQQLTEARVWMSEIVVRIACERATDEDFAALDANIDAAAKAPDFDQRARHNREFHVILARATRNPIMVITMESIMAVFGNFIAQIGPSDNDSTHQVKYDGGQWQCDCNYFGSHQVFPTTAVMSRAMFIVFSFRAGENPSGFS